MLPFREQSAINKITVVQMLRIISCTSAPKGRNDPQDPGTTSINAKPCVTDRSGTPQRSEEYSG